jgi:D-alanine-D-alanine ligase
MRKLNIALLSGGKSSERQVSLKGGDQVFDALDKEKYKVTRYDPKFDIDRLVQDASEIDMALIILHGPYGEDGTIQGLLDLLDIPYQGAGVLGSALAMNKLAAKQIYEQSGLRVTPYMVKQRKDSVKPGEYIEKFGLPLVVKPVQGGSSIGMSLVKEESSFQKAFEKAFDYDETVLVEKYIGGIELTGGIIGNDTLEALPVVEIIPDKRYDFFDYDAKYTSGATQEICPARIDASISQKVQEYSKMAHRALFCRGYSRTDFILEGKDLYLLETNTIPGMTQTSLLPLAAKAAGISFTQLLDKLIKLSIEGCKINGL